MAVLYKTNGEVEQIAPANGKTFTLEEMQNVVGGYIDIQPLPKMGMVMILNDNGKNEGLEKNNLATEIWKKEYPIAEFPENNDELVVGNVIICPEHNLEQ